MSKDTDREIDGLFNAVINNLIEDIDKLAVLDNKPELQKVKLRIVLKDILGLIDAVRTECLD